MAISHANLLEKKGVDIREFKYLPGLVWNTNMVAVSMVWDTSTWLSRCRVKMKHLIQTTRDVFIAFPDWKPPAYTGSVDFATSISGYFSLASLIVEERDPLVRAQRQVRQRREIRAWDPAIGLSELYTKLSTRMYPRQKFLFFLHGGPKLQHRLSLAAGKADESSCCLFFPDDLSSWFVATWKTSCGKLWHFCTGYTNP